MDDGKFLAICCPTCGCCNCHFGKGKVKKVKEYSSWYGRGPCLVIPIDGECGHKWNICYGEHKGDLARFIEIC